MSMQREVAPRGVPESVEDTRWTNVALGGGLLLAVAVVLAGFNRRPAVTSVGSVLDELRVDLGASVTWAGLLTTLPGLCFAVGGLVAPRLSRRTGLRSAITAALFALAAGLVLRVLGGPSFVLVGTVVACGGIALTNVLVPVVVKASFATKVGLMTGLYTAALQAGAAVGSAATPPLETALGGWRPALVSWAVLAVAALVAWWVATNAGIPGAPTEDDGGHRSLLRVPLAWAVTGFFGCQACLAYVVMGWLPQVLMDAGVDRAEAGLLLGLVSLLALPVSFVFPALAARGGSQSGWIVLLGVVGAAGVLGLVLAPSASPLLWSVLLGLGMSAFSLALVTITLRARDNADTTALSGMAQGFGYLAAAVGPFLFGLLRDVTGAWTIPLLLLLVVALAQIGFGYVAGKPRYV